MNDWNSREYIYIDDWNKFETYEKIYQQIQYCAMDWASDNCRIDSDTIYSFLEAFSDEEIQQDCNLEKYDLKDITFVTESILNNKEIYFESEEDKKWKKLK